ncbi:MAG: hypothetical protein DRI39_07105 [Chloroflexi bacterium]|nr:MAG: hypothetical protein DRI39_07105 [Chloroflexota bacterium]
MREALRRVLRGGIDLLSILVHPASKRLGKNKIRILCYHRVCGLPKTNDIMDSLNVTPGEFAKQMAFLSQNGFNSVTLEDLIEYRQKGTKPPPRTVIVTFDDGYRDNCLNAFPIMEQYGIKGTFFVVTDYIDTDRIFHWLHLGGISLSHSQENRQCWRPLSRHEIAEMSARGACFGSHTKTHCYLSQVDETTALEELKGSRECLEEILRRPVTCLSYPHADTNESVKGWVQEAGYRAAVVIKGTSNTLKSDFLELGRVSIGGEDSLAKFMRKVDGAYDWWYDWLRPLVTSSRRILARV